MTESRKHRAKVPKKGILSKNGLQRFANALEEHAYRCLVPAPSIGMNITPKVNHTYGIKTRPILQR